MNPQAYNPETKMPNLRLKPQQAKDITAYLLENKNTDFDDLPDHHYDENVLNELTIKWLKKSNPEKFADDPRRSVLEWMHSSYNQVFAQLGSAKPVCRSSPFYIAITAIGYLKRSVGPGSCDLSARSLRESLWDAHL